MVDNRWLFTWRKTYKNIFFTNKCWKKQLLVPFKITLPNDLKPLFKYAVYITYITDNLNIGVANWLGTVNNSTTGSQDAIRCSSIAILLRTSKDLKYLKVNGAIIQEQTMQDLCNNKTIITLELCNNSFNYEELKEIIIKNGSLISLSLHKSAIPQVLLRMRFARTLL